MAAMSESTESLETAPEQAQKQTMDILEIMSILPHRYPFLLIDRVVEMEPFAVALLTGLRVLNLRFVRPTPPTRLPTFPRLEVLAASGN